MMSGVFYIGPAIDGGKRWPAIHRSGSSCPGDWHLHWQNPAKRHQVSDRPAGLNIRSADDPRWHASNDTTRSPS
jgi:hypothetical protein